MAMSAGWPISLMRWPVRSMDSPIGVVVSVLMIVTWVVMPLTVSGGGEQQGAVVEGVGVEYQGVECAGDRDGATALTVPLSHDGHRGGGGAGLGGRHLGDHIGPVLVVLLLDSANRLAAR